MKRTRKLLQQAFMELFQEKSFAAINIQDITGRATVNLAIFYAHFSDKYALLDYIMREQFKHTVTAQLAATSRGGMTGLRQLIRATFDFLRELHHHCKPSDTQFDPLMERAIQQELAEILLNWLRQPGVIGKHRVHVETIAAAMSWAIFGTAVQWSRNGQTLSVEEMTNQVLLILTEGGMRLAPGLFAE